MKDVKLIHPLNAFFPIEETPSEIYTLLSFEHESNALFPISITLLGSNNETKSVHPLNAFFPIFLTPSDRMAVVNPVQSEKAPRPIV